MIPTPDVQASDAWQECWDSFELDMSIEGLSVSTVANRRSAVTIMAKHFTHAGIDPAAVTKGSLGSYLTAQLPGRKGCGAAALFRELHAFWGWWSGEYGQPNPMDGRKRPKSRPEMVLVPTAKDVARLLRACKDPRDRALIGLLVESGLRRAEACALDVGNLDIRARTVHVETSKTGRSRYAVFGDDTALALKRWLRSHPSGSGPLFPARAGTRLTPDGLSQLINRLGRKAGVKIRPHQLRHFWAHTSLAAGAPEGALIEAGGWTTSRMIHEVYGKQLAGDRAIDALRSVQVGRMLGRRVPARGR